MFSNLLFHLSFAAKMLENKMLFSEWIFIFLFLRLEIICLESLHAMGFGEQFYRETNKLSVSTRREMQTHDGSINLAYSLSYQPTTPEMFFLI